MNDLITPANKIVEELKAIQSVLETELSEEIQEAVERGNYSMVQMARTGKLLADAKIHRDRKLNSGVVENLKRVIALPASTANKYIDALCYDENYLVNWCDRVNRTCTHQVEWCRTLISKAKAEYQAFGQGNPN